MALSDDERARLAAKYESAALRPTLSAHPILKNPRAGVWAVTLLVFCWLLLTMRTPFQRCDDIYFYVGARSIAAGQGFTDISRPDKPPQLKYPPLRALLQVPFLPLLDDGIIRPLRVLSMAFFAGLLPLAYALLAPRAGHRAALWALLLSGLSPSTARMANFEGNFGVVAFSWTLCFFLAERVQTENRREALWGALLGLGLTMAFYSHRMAFALIPGLGGYLFLIGRRRGALIALAIAVALCLPWQYRSWLASGHWVSGDYEADLSMRVREDTGSLGTYMLRQAIALPTELGYGILPWWRASGGAVWPQLARLGLGWIGPLSAWLVSGLLFLGWARSVRREKTPAGWYFPVHTLMMLAFFIGFHYYSVMYPWIFVWLWSGVQALRLPRKLSTVAAALLLTVTLAKGVRAFLLFPSSPLDRDTRWTWVTRLVPQGETVYYLGLENYALAPLRWFDTERMAFGITEKELEEDREERRWISLPKDHALSATLKARGYRRIAWERLDQLPPGVIAYLSDAQRNFLRLREPPQSLWTR